MAEDNLKDKRKAEKRDTDDYVITSEMLVEIVEESIRTFWRFVRADKDCSVASVNSNKKLPELPSHEDHKLVVEIRKDLQKVGFLWLWLYKYGELCRESPRLDSSITLCVS